MRVALTMLLGLAVAVALVAGTQAADEQTLKGTITCAKCDLKKEKACATVIVVTKDGKDTVYYFDPDSHKKNHKAICTDPKKGEVKGTVSEKGGKHIVKVSAVKFD
jgi:hypothetical protein